MPFLGALVRPGPCAGTLAAQRWAAACSEREVGRMAVRKIAHPSIEDRKAMAEILLHKS